MGDVTQLLHAAAEGRKDAFDEAIAIVYDDLERLARKHARRVYGARLDDVTLEPAALVNETFMRLARQHAEFRNRVHLFAIATRVMVRALLDYERARLSRKRGGGQVRVTLTGISPSDPGPQATTVTAIAQALDRLEQLDPRKAQVMRLRTFWGFTNAEVAEILQVSTPTIERDWRFSKSWLADVLDGPPTRSGG